MNYVSSKLTAAKRLSRYVIVVWFLTNNPLIFRRGCQLQCGGGEHSSDHNSNNIHGWVGSHWVSHTSENNWEMLEFHFSSFYPEHFQSKHAGTISYSYCFFSFLMYAFLFLFPYLMHHFQFPFLVLAPFLGRCPIYPLSQSANLQNSNKSETPSKLNLQADKTFNSYN